MSIAKFFVLLLAPCVATFAAAPASLAGKTYRSHAIWKGTSPRYRKEQTIVFLDDRRFMHLKEAQGEHFMSWDEAKVELQAPKPDGTYVYARLSDTAGRVSLSYDDGARDELALTFTTANGGGDLPTIAPGTVAVSFFFSDHVAAQAHAPSNVSLRGQVSPGKPFIVGFIVPGPPAAPRDLSLPALGEESKEVVIRAVGPSLQKFGVTGVWADPDFVVYRGNSAADLDEKHNPDWDANAGVRGGLEKVFGRISAFPLLTGSKEAADVLRLTPGAYTVVCQTGAGDPGGEVLVEIYFLP